MQVIVNNRKAKFNYQLLQFFECGLVLTGTEIKSLRAGKVVINEAYGHINKKGELYLLNAHIEEYEMGNRFNHSPGRERKLLVHPKELHKMQMAIERLGQTLVPTKIYLKGRWAKVEIAIAKGKSKGDKRQDKTNAEAKRQIDRVMKQGRM